MIHGRIRAPYQGLRVSAARWVEADSDAYGNVKHSFGYTIWFYQFPQQLARNTDGILLVADLRRQDHEFIAAPGPTVSESRTQARSRFAPRPVPLRVKQFEDAQEPFQIRR